MKMDDETMYDSEETVCDSEGTVPDPERPVADGATAADDVTIRDGATLLYGTTVYDAAGGLSQAKKAAAIEKGQTLLDTYHIESDAIEGGMGKVWRVHRQSWNVDLAMKQPKASLFQTGSQKANFIHECEAWINLGLHPHIVSCYYVREIGGIPTIFSEWMDGGSLRNIIEDGSLYSDAAGERILDIAIQFARGLHYAHEQGLIHQDVKPDNLLLNKNGDAKVADFGIAKARAALTVADADMPEDATMFSASGGYTPAYCSIEQANGEKLTRRTDIYSWAVSVMEMYLGERPWVNGVIAGTACESYFPEARVAIPEGMMSLLKECMNADEAKRPHDFALVEARLLEIYRSETGRAYSRISPKAAADTADSLNNRALSFLDIGKPEEAEKCWEKALALDPKHPEAVANHTLHLWRSGAIDDLETVRRMEALHQNSGTWRSEYTIAQVQLERGDTESALAVLTDVLAKSGGNAEVERDLAFVSREDSGWRIIPLFQKNAWFKCLSPDGKMAVAQADDGLRVLDVGSGEILQTLPVKLSNWYVPVCFSSDGNLVLSSSPLQLWEVKTGSCRYKFGGHAYSACFSSDGKYILSGEDTTIRLWDAESGVCLQTLNGHSVKPHCNRGVRAVCFSPDGRFALSGAGDETLKLWDLKSGECSRTFMGHSYEVFSACFSPDGAYALSGGEDQTMRLWDVDTGQCLRLFPKDTFLIAFVCFSPDGTRAISSYSGCAIRVWDVKTGKCLRTLPLPKAVQDMMGHKIDSLHFTPDGQELFYVCGQNCFRVQAPKSEYKADWALCRVHTVDESLQNETKLKRALRTAEAALVRNDITQALQALREAASIPGLSVMPAFRELNFRVGRFCRAQGLLFCGLEAAFPCDIKEAAARGPSDILALSREGKHLLSADAFKTVARLWEIKSGKELHVLRHERKIRSACFSSDGKYLLTGSEDTTMKLWNVQTGQCLRTFAGNDGYITSVDFSQDGNYALSNYSKGSKLWSTKTGECLSVLEGHYNARFCPDGLHLLSNKHLYNYKTGECKKSYPGRSFQENMYYFCISPDSRSVLASSGRKLALYDVNSGECLHIFSQNTDYSNSCPDISPDGRYALSCEGKTLALWDMKTYDRLRTFTADFQITIFHFSPAGDYAIAACNDGTTLFWRLDYEYEFPGWSDWDEGAKPYLKAHTARYPELKKNNFNQLIADLQNRGYGWLRPEGIRAKLEEMRPKKKGLFSWIRK